MKFRVEVQKSSVRMYPLQSPKGLGPDLFGTAESSVCGFAKVPVPYFDLSPFVFEGEVDLEEKIFILSVEIVIIVMLLIR